jgi:hypothetical protein
MIYLLLFPIVLFSNETFFSSDKLAYHKQNLSLEGNVSIKHPLGIVKADSAEVSGLTESSFLKAMLKNNVEFFFREDRLCASELLIDSENNQISTSGGATLFGKSENFSLSCDGTTKFEKSSNKLTFTSKFLPILFSKGDTLISAKSAFLTFELDEPTTLVFDQGVDLSNGNIKGMAETLVYTLKDHSLKGIGKVSFILQDDETGNLLELWKKKSF